MSNAIMTPTKARNVRKIVESLPDDELGSIIESMMRDLFMYGCFAGLFTGMFLGFMLAVVLAVVLIWQRIL